jgi:hypothetical protein
VKDYSTIGNFFNLNLSCAIAEGASLGVLSPHVSWVLCATIIHKHGKKDFFLQPTTLSETGLEQDINSLFFTCKEVFKGPELKKGSTHYQSLAVSQSFGHRDSF